MPGCLISRPDSRLGAARLAECLIRLRPGWVPGPSQQAEHTPHLALRYNSNLFLLCIPCSQAQDAQGQEVHTSQNSNVMDVLLISQEYIACCRRRGSEAAPGQRELRSPSSLEGCPQPSIRPRYFIHI